MTAPELVTASLPIGPKPTHEELDLFGLTHPGLVRSEGYRSLFQSWSCPSETP